MASLPMCSAAEMPMGCTLQAGQLNSLFKRRAPRTCSIQPPNSLHPAQFPTTGHTDLPTHYPIRRSPSLSTSPRTCTSRSVTGLERRELMRPWMATASGEVRSTADPSRPDTWLSMRCACCACCGRPRSSAAAAAATGPAGALAVRASPRPFPRPALGGENMAAGGCSGSAAPSCTASGPEACASRCSPAPAAAPAAAPALSPAGFSGALATSRVVAGAEANALPLPLPLPAAAAARSVRSPLPPLLGTGAVRRRAWLPPLRGGGDVASLPGLAVPPRCRCVELQPIDALASLTVCAY